MSDPLAQFTPQVREWFARAFEAPTAAQEQAWPAIATGEHVLISAPTGSGKTLAAFLYGLDRFLERPSHEQTRLVYVSPLKALSYDVEKNLRAPLRGIGAELNVAIRTGDTPQKERRDMVKHPPDVLITTPESLYLMLTSGAREIFAETETVIIDEIHAVSQTKRGAHLALTLERLVERAGRRVPRVRLCAWENPEAHPCAGEEAPRKSIWPAIYPELPKLVRQHRSTLIFVNNRRAAERLALRLNELAGEASARG